MTEADWLACTDPEPMLEFLRGKVSDRKLRLFATAFCRQAWELLTDEYTRLAAESLERYTEGMANEEQLAFANGYARIGYHAAFKFLMEPCPTNHHGTAPANRA